MSFNRAHILVIALAVVGLTGAAGCGGDDDAESAGSEAEVTGDPPPATTPEEPAENPGGSGADGERPVSLPLDDVQPCDLLTPSIRREFGLRTEDRDVDSLDQPTCNALAGPPGGYVVTAAHGEGMERFEGIPEEVATVRRLTVGGFPAADLIDPNLPSSCLVGIDVADAQHLAIFVSDLPDGGTDDQICKSAADFGEALVEELRAQAEP